MNNYYVYILTNKSHTTLYVGVTNDLQRRVFEHKNDMLDGFSKKYQLHKLVFLEHVNNIESAIAREKQLKGWSREKKESLINSMNPQWNEIVLE